MGPLIIKMPKTFFINVQFCQFVDVWTPLRLPSYILIIEFEGDLFGGDPQEGHNLRLDC